jgi:hypothetical protein
VAGGLAALRFPTPTHPVPEPPEIPVVLLAPGEVEVPVRMEMGLPEAEVVKVPTAL